MRYEYDDQVYVVHAISYVLNLLEEKIGYKLTLS